MPYDQFVMNQLAADQMPGNDKKNLAALGLLTVGERFQHGGATQFAREQGLVVGGLEFVQARQIAATRPAPARQLAAEQAVDGNLLFSGVRQ